MVTNTDRRRHASARACRHLPFACSPDLYARISNGRSRLSHARRSARIGRRGDAARLRPGRHRTSILIMQRAGEKKLGFRGRVEIARLQSETRAVPDGPCTSDWIWTRWTGLCAGLCRTMNGRAFGERPYLSVLQRIRSDDYGADGVEYNPAWRDVTACDRVVCGQAVRKSRRLPPQGEWNELIFPLEFSRRRYSVERCGGGNIALAMGRVLAQAAERAAVDFRPAADQLAETAAKRPGEEKGRLMRPVTRIFARSSSNRARARLFYRRHCVCAELTVTRRGIPAPAIRSSSPILRTAVGRESMAGPGRGSAPGRR